MALRMPRPFEHKTGVFFLNVRVPSDLVAKARAMRISLPVEDRLVTIVVTDKVFLSLKTKDAALARTRFVEAYGVLVRQWEAMRAGPQTKLLREIAKVVRLAGEKLARNMDGDYSDDPNITRFPVFERAVGKVLGSIYQIGIDALSRPWHGRHPNR